jgi:peptide/nickel transport system permease protein
MTGRRILGFMLRRVLVSVPLILLVSFGVFSLLHLAPGDPARALLGSHPADPATLAALRAKYNLDDPFLVQYGKWLLQVCRGDFGRSITSGQLVTSAIAQRIGITIFLSIFSSVIVLVVGSTLGIIAALRRGSLIDRGVVMLSVFGISSPAFVTGIFLLYFLGVVIGAFPIYGEGVGFFDRLWHLTLPALALAISVMAIIVKITRAAMIEELGKDYMTFARARGIPPSRLLFRYALRNALIPVVTAAGLIVVGLLAGAVYVEVTFSLPGLGSLMIEAVQKRDIPLVQGSAVFFSAFVIIINLAVDLLYILIDPRIGFEKAPS